MITNQIKSDELVAVLNSCSEKKGVFLMSRKYSKHKYQQKPIWNQTILSMKQHLFFSHRPSFYGVCYDTVFCDFNWNNTHHTAESIWIPLDKVHHLAELDQNHIVYKLTTSFRSLLSLLSTIIHLIETKQLHPQRDATWLDINQMTKFKNQVEILTSTRDDPNNPYIFSNHHPDLVSSFLEAWIPTYIATTDFYQQEFLPYKKTLLNKTDDSQLLHWLEALQQPDETRILSKHHYPMCLHYWNEDGTPPFQLQLIIFEPDTDTSEQKFRLEWFAKEWKTGGIASLEKIIEGIHPFRSNPTQWLQKEMNRVKQNNNGKQIILDDPKSYRFYLDLKELEDFLIDEVKSLEADGIPVLIPEQFKQKVIPQLQAIIHAPDQSNHIDQLSAWVTSQVSWKLRVNETDIDETLFKQMVEMQQQIIHIHGEWVMWDLDAANQLLSRMEQTKQSTDFSFLDALRSSLQVENDPAHSPSVMNHSSQELKPIEWTLSSEMKALLTHSKKKENELSPYWKSSLRDYQQIGVNWLLTMRALHLGACLADDMGLGKTIQTIAYIDLVLKNEKKIAPFLIVCPSSVVHNWQLELNRFTPELSVFIYEGPPIERQNELGTKRHTSDVIITSYAIATRDRDILTNEQWFGCIFDEAQMLKNIRTQQRKAMRSITSSHPIALTGTPIENHPFEMWSLMDLLNPGLLKDEYSFSEKFIRFSSEQERERNLEQLSKIVRPFLLRRSKSDYLEELSLPEKKIFDHPVSLTSEQTVLYEATVEDLMRAYQDQPIYVQRALLFKTMTKLKQICNHPGQLLREDSTFLLEAGRSEKWDLTRKLMESWLQSGKKGLVFTQYRFVGKLIQMLGKKKWEIPIPFFHGGLTSRRRKEMIENFQANKSAPIIVISLRAGGFGINLTEATEVIHYDRWWNPAVEAQATDRVHRIGQRKPVQIHTITTRGTLEERIADLIEKKKQLQKALLDGRPLPIWELSQEELTELFSLE